MPRRRASCALRGGRDVVGRRDGAHLDAVVAGQLGRHVEVQDVAAVIAVEVEHARAAVDRLRHLEHLLRATATGRRRRWPRRRAGPRRRSP